MGVQCAVVVAWRLDARFRISLEVDMKVRIGGVDID